MRDMHRSAMTFYNRFGVMPSDCYEEMEQRGMIEMKRLIVDVWDFQCDWEFDDAEKELTGTITASSTESNDVGPGETIIYDLYTGECTGYGQGTEE